MITRLRWPVRHSARSRTTRRLASPSNGDSCDCSVDASTIARRRVLRSLNTTAAASMAQITPSDRYVLRWYQWLTVILIPTNTRMPPRAWER